MFVGVFLIEVFLPGSSSLKDKRRVISSISRRLKNRFNISIAEVDNQDTWQRATIGISYVNSAKKNVGMTYDSILRCVETEGELRIINCGRTIY